MIVAKIVLIPRGGARAEAGSGTTENTKPALEIANQTGIKVVVQINYTDTIPNGMSKQVMAVKNLYDQYTALGMKPRKDYEIVMVFRADGAQFMLTDEAYALKVKKPHPKGNPNKAMIEAMHKGRVKMYECHLAIKLKGYKPDDIFPFSRVVVSGSWLHLQRGNTIRKEVVNDDVVNPTRVTPNFAKKEEDEKINDCFNGIVCF